jgi:site-specific DNA recombinase
MTSMGDFSGRVPVAFLGRTSTLAMQDARASMRRQLRKVEETLPAGWYIAAHYWDIESGGMDLEDRGHGTAHEQVDTGIPRDGGIAAMLAEASSPNPRFAAVMCEDIERSGRDTFNALKLERQLSAAGVPLLATDEPIDVAGMNATTLLVRRVKQGVAEWYRLQLKEKAWQGFREHALEGYNTGQPPYGYAAHRIPHPAPAKAADGRTKTRLMLDPERAPIVAKIFEWRVIDRLGMNTIAARLNADPAAPPPPGRAGCWQVTTVAAMLANPKYTGYMVFGRTRTIGGKRGRKTTPDQWLWSPEPAHPAIITRALWDAAQTAGQAHGNTRDDTGPLAAANYNYPLRGIIFCRECRRRMTGRRKTGRPGSRTHTYYGCTHNVANPRHAAARPDHPASVLVREDLMQACVAQFFDQRIFGPDRRQLLAAAMPDHATDAAQRRDTETSKLRQRIRQIDAAENAHAREIEHLATQPAGAPAITALRTRILDRFAELEDERARINTTLIKLASETPAPTDPALLDQIPHLAGILADAPARLQQDLYRAFQVQILYNPDGDQVTCHATITPTTPLTVAAILADSEPPQPSAASTPPASDPSDHTSANSPELARSLQVPG